MKTENIISKLENQLKMAKQTQIVFDCYNKGGLFFYDLTGEKISILDNNKKILRHAEFGWTASDCKNYEELYKICFQKNLSKEDKKILNAVKFVANNIKDNSEIFNMFLK